MVVMIITLGCHHPEPAAQLTLPRLNGSPQDIESQASELATGLVGSWRWSLESGEEGDAARIFLSADGRWRMWSSVSGSSPSEGSWFVHERILVLRLEGENKGHVPPGMAFTFDIRTVAPDKATLATLMWKGEVRWERLTQQVEAPNERR